MHVVERFALPHGYIARPYTGRDDHATMAAILTDHRRRTGELELVTAEQIDVDYQRLERCDPARDVFLIETVRGDPVAYGRSIYDDLVDGTRDCLVFAPTVSARARC